MRWYRKGPRTSASRIAYLEISLSFIRFLVMGVYQIRADGHVCCVLAVDVRRVSNVTVLDEAISEAKSAHTSRC